MAKEVKLMEYVSDFKADLVVGKKGEKIIGDLLR